MPLLLGGMLITCYATEGWTGCTRHRQLSWDTYAVKQSNVHAITKCNAFHMSIQCKYICEQFQG